MNRTANIVIEKLGATYSEISSNVISTSSALLAAAASSSPVASIGPVNNISWPRCLSSNPCGPLPERTCAASRATSWTEVSLPAPKKLKIQRTWTHSEGDRGKLVILTNWGWNDAIILSLRRVEQQVFRIEPGPE